VAKSLARAWPAPSLGVGVGVGVGELARFHIEKDNKVYALTDDLAEKRFGARTWHW